MVNQRPTAFDKAQENDDALNEFDEKIDPKKVFKIVLFSAFNQAKQKKSQLKELASSCDQLNIVIEEEGNMDDSDLVTIAENIKLFAGKAWYTIHTRRIKNQWYAQENIFEKL